MLKLVSEFNVLTGIFKLFYYFFILRKRSAGTNVLTLACGKKITKIDEVMVDDPFKLNSGGLVDMKNMKGILKYFTPFPFLHHKRFVTLCFKN
jgi:hypothetical protein